MKYRLLPYGIFPTFLEFEKSKLGEHARESNFFDQLYQNTLYRPFYPNIVLSAYLFHRSEESINES